MPTVSVDDVRGQYGTILDRASRGEWFLVTTGRARRPHAVIGPPPGPGGIDMSQLTTNADELERVLRAKHGGDLDKIATEAQDFALAAIAVAKRVESERQRQRAADVPDHK